MSKTVRMLLVVTLLALIVSACGGDKKEKKVSLSETFTSSTGIGVKYPQGWAAKEVRGYIYVSDSQETLDTMDSEATQETFLIAIIMLLPAGQAASPHEALATAIQTLEDKGETEGSTMGEVTDTQVGGKPAASAVITDDTGKAEAKMFAIDAGGGNYAIAGMVVALGKLEDYEETGLDIIASITYEEKKASLSETYTASTGISVKYPQGWAVKEEGGQIIIANSQEVLDAPSLARGMFGVVITLSPAGVAPTPRNALIISIQRTATSTGTEGTIGEVTDTIVGGKTAASATLSDNTGDGVALAIDLGDGNIALVTLVAAKGELKNYEATGMDIAASITYTAPAQ